VRLKRNAETPRSQKGNSMKYFTINDENNITAHSSKEEAAALANEIMFSTEKQFADLVGVDGKRMIDVWNSLPGVTPVKKFTSKQIAQARIWKALQSLTCPAKPAQPEIPASVRAQAADVAPAAIPSTEHATPFDERPSAPENGKVRDGSKTAKVLALVQAEGGATLQEIMAATDWQAHSVRGFISGTLNKKMGMTIARTKRADGSHAYVIAGK
jgi:hypothetical protein